MNTADILFSLLRSEFCHEEVSEDVKNSLDEDMLTNLYSLSKAHDMAHIVACALSKISKLGDGAISAKYKKQQIIAVYRFEQINYEYERICETLNAAKIAFMPLKGSVIRKYYPEEWMRTSCDIDVLIHKEELDKAQSALCAELSYVPEEKPKFHDISLISDSGVNLELHFNILENTENIDRMLSKVWEYSLLADNEKYMYAQTNEYLIFHQVAHMYYHFIKGGCGIKPFIDVYLLDKNIEYDRSVVEEYCRNCGIERFYLNATKLIGVWLENKPHTELTRQMEEYILTGGVYGTLENKVAIDHKGDSGKLGFICKRIFISYAALKKMYPIIGKYKILTPIMHLRRWFNLIFKGKLKKSVSELQISNSLEKEKVSSVSEMFKELGI